MQQWDQYWCKWLLFPFHIWALFCVALLLFSIWVLLLKCPSMQHGGVGLLLPNVQLHRAAQNIQYNTNSFLLNTIRQRNKMPSIWLAQRATLHHAKQNPVFQFSSCRTRMCWGLTKRQQQPGAHQSAPGWVQVSSGSWKPAVVLAGLVEGECLEPSTTGHPLPRQTPLSESTFPSIFT